MNFVTIIWSVVAAGALLLALMHTAIWLMDRKARASLAFAVEAYSIVISAILELGLMHAATPAEWGEWVRWVQVPILLRTVGLVAFIWFYFGTGSAGLAWFLILGRALIFVVGFIVDPNFNFTVIHSIDQVHFLGQQITTLGVGEPRSYQWFATLNTYLVLVFIAHASIQLWRKGTPEARRKVIVIGGAAFVSWIIANTYTQLMIFGGVKGPVLLSPPFLIMLMAMTFELSRDTLRASRLTRELRDSEGRLQIAASAAGLGIWTWDAQKNQMWATSRAREMFALPGEDPIDIARMLAMIRQDDAARIEAVWRGAAATGNEAEVQFQITLPDGSKREMVAHGRSEADMRGKLTSLKGVVRDVTEQVRAREENEELRRDLAHVGRVSVLGTLSSSLAHELSQPLGAILLNAEAAELLLKKPNPDLEEIRQILADIHRDDHRAAEVIDRLRKLLKHSKLDIAPVSVDGLLQDVAALLKSDAIARNVTLECRCDSEIPPVRGDRVHLSQVLINLVMNAMDAVAELPPARRGVTVRARTLDPDYVEISVADSGPGVPADLVKKIFDPFFTTKPNGMGMGLSMSRTIVEAHGGRLWVENNLEGGAIFLATLPVVR